MPFELIGDAVVDKIRRQIGLIQGKMKNSGLKFHLIIFLYLVFNF